MVILNLYYIQTFFYRFIQVIIDIEFIMLVPAILLELTIILKGGHNRKIKKIRNQYIKQILLLHNKFFYALGLLVLNSFKLIKRMYFRIKYSNKELKKLNYDDFYNAIKNQTPSEFEEFTANLYKGLGYNVKLMPPGPDGGKDVILQDSSGKIYVECKHYTKAIIGREICQKLVGAAMGDGIDRVILFTCGDINDNGYEYLKKINNRNNINFEVATIDKIYNLYLMSKTINNELCLRNTKYRNIFG